MVRVRTWTGARVLSLLGASFFTFLAAACAVGVELDPALFRHDAGRDGAHGGVDMGASGSAGRFDASGMGGGGAAGGGGDSLRDASRDVAADAIPFEATAFDGPVPMDSSCVATQKLCGGRCVVPEARYGCDLAGCDPCPTPENSYAHCTGTQCDFNCNSGFVRSGQACVPDDGGSQDGSSSSDAGDGGVVCGSMACSGCIPFIQRSCCKPDDTCGCMYIIGGPCN